MIKPLLEEIFRMTSDIAWREFSLRLQRRCLVRWTDLAQHLDTGCDDSENHHTWKQHHSHDCDGDKGKLFSEVVAEGLEDKVGKIPARRRLEDGRDDVKDEIHPPDKQDGRKEKKKAWKDKYKPLMKKVKTKNQGSGLKT